MHKNIVILSIDSLRLDGVNYNRKLIYGSKQHEYVATPNLDKFAKKSTVFLKAYSTNTYTTSTHASLFTGTYPPIHGIRNFFDFNQKLNKKVKTMAEEFNELGFQTFFYSDIKELFSEMDVWRGFKIKTYDSSNWLWDSITDLKKDRNLIFYHLFDVHAPYLFIEDQSNTIRNDDYYDAIYSIRKTLNLKSRLNQKKLPHESWREIKDYININKLSETEYLSKFYYKGIEKFDKHRFPIIMENFNKLGFNMDNTLFVLISDHGEGKTHFFNNTHLSHGGELTEEVLRINIFGNFPIQKHKVNSLFTIKDLKDLLLNYILKGRFEFRTSDIIYAERTVTYLKESHYLTLNMIKQAIKSGVISFLQQRAIISNNSKKIILGNLDDFLIHKEKVINQKNVSLLITAFFNRPPLNQDEIDFYNRIFNGKASEKVLKDLLDRFPDLPLSLDFTIKPTRLHEAFKSKDNSILRYNKLLKEISQIFNEKP